MASNYSFIDAMYQHLIYKKHTVSELKYLKKLGYMQNDMTAYLCRLNDMPDLFFATEKLKGRIYKCLAGTIS